jgi:hypothetical protein
MSDIERHLESQANAEDDFRQELVDILSEAIDDSMDMDWRSQDGARSILRRLKEEGLAIIQFPTHPTPVVIEGIAFSIDHVVAWGKQAIEAHLKAAAISPFPHFFVPDASAPRKDPS